VLTGVAVFIDCDSPLLPWDSIDEFPLTLELWQNKKVSIPLATNLENALGVNVCGQLEVQFDNLPSFCSVAGADLKCTPTSPEHVGVHNFKIRQVALEHPLATRSFSAHIPVIEPADPPSFEAPTNKLPFFDPPLP